MLQIIGSSKAWIALADQALIRGIAALFLIFGVSSAFEFSGRNLIRRVR